MKSKQQTKPYKRINQKRVADDNNLRDMHALQKELSEKTELFDELPISQQTKKGMKRNGFVKMTEIQAATTHLALKGKDLVGSARTGSGKTLSYLLPMLELLYKEKWSSTDGLGALVVAPTRELALQIFKVLHAIGTNHTFSAGLLIGGKNVAQEKTRLNKMNILIATPGRLLQHMDETYGFSADNLKMLILDEADRILDLGFAKTVHAIIDQLPPTHTRQNLLFSATISASVASLAKMSLNDPAYVELKNTDNGEDPTPKNLAQFYSLVPLHRKLDVLFGFVKSHKQNKVLVFASSCKQVRHIYETFSHLRPGISLMQLHGKLKQAKRHATLAQFSRASHAVLFATDIAARGLDIPAVDWVVQLDAPEDADTYIHRVGRTARYNSKGCALMLVEPAEKALLKRLEEKHITPKGTKIKEKLMQPIGNALQAHAFQDTEIKYLAQKAFVSYVRSLHLMKDKEVFDVTRYPLSEYAGSLGLPGVPKVKFMAAEKARARAEDKKEVSESEQEQEQNQESGDDSEDTDLAKQTQKESQSKPGVRTKYDKLFERKNQGQLSEHYNALVDRNREGEGESDEELMTITRRDHELESGGSDGEEDDAAGNLSKRKLRAGQSKKAIAGKSEPGHKLRFDEDGQAHELYELQKGEDVDVDNEKKRFIDEQNKQLKLADVENKRVAKEKRDEKKRKRKDREVEGDDSDDAAEAVIGDGEDDGYVSPEFDLGDEDEIEGESGSDGESDDKESSQKKQKKESETRDIDDDEEYALSLLRN
ncbi:hypothetical protein E3P86_00219 [Wallemia ichthyophaga]|uniref:ATP-dependent RNA helicase n=1 Tax=Wallemia ichthyophaga TaxID=245174 RepID=A0A4T0JI23_WALIC|nr:hypothetical protein E3P86_00219 [Wallemia ichthyophaga]